VPETTPDVRAILSDLDDTLFDHTHATRRALAVLHAEVPEFRAWPREVLEARHGIALELMHGEVLAGRVSIEVARTERFRRLLDEAAPGGVASAEIAADLARRYRGAYERAWRPVAGALALAAAVKRAGLALVIVTNNVTSEQRLKLERCGLAPHVDALVTSEAVGATKPDARIFEAALAYAGVPASEAVMIGDAWHTDIAGALAAGIRAVWLNHAGLATPHPAPVAEVRSLEPLADVWRALVPAL
jgi:putative hydrolase of the HAD superfamily